MAGDSERRDLSTLHRVGGSDNAPTADDSDDGRPPSITIEELDDDVFEGYAEDARMMVIRHRNEREEQQEEELMNPTSVSYAHLLIAPSRRAPLEVIREEELDGDGSDGEFSHRSPTTTEPAAYKRDDPPPKQDVPDGESTVASGDAVAHGLARFSPAKVLRDILRYRTRRRRGNRKQQPRHRGRQEQTTCVLVDAKEADIAPQEYRSVCTTETVSCEMLEVEVINIGSNSSSLDDLSDVDADTAGQQLNEEETVPEEEHGKLELDRTEHTADSGALEKRPQTVHQLADDGSRQLEHESIKTQMIPDAQVLEINLRGGGGASSDHRRSASSSYQLDNTHHNSSLAADHDLHQTEENDLSTQTPRCDDIHVERPTVDGSRSEAAPAHPVVSSGSSQNLEHDDDGDDDDDDDAAGDGGDRQERSGSERTGDNDTNGNIPESDSGRSPATPEAADTGGALLGISSSGVASVDRDRASVVGVDVGVDSGDDASVPKVSLKNPPPSEFDRAASNGVGTRVNHCARYEEGPPPPPGATTMSIEDESVSAVAVGKKGHRPPPLPPVPAPRVAAIPLPPPPTDGGASTGVTQLGRSQPVGGNEEAHSTQQEVLEPTRGSVAPPPPPPPAAYHLVPLTVEALSSGASSPTSLQNGQIHTGGHTDQTDHADADQGSAQDSVDAVAAPEVSDPDRTAVIEQVAPAECENDQSVLLKYMQEDDSVSERANSSSETVKSSDQVNDGRIADDFDEHRSKRTTGQPTAPSIRSDPGESSREGRGPKIEPSGGSRRGGQYLCDGFDAAVVRRPQASRNLDPVQAGGAGMGAAEPAERNRLPDTKTSTGGKQSSSSSSSSSSSGPQLSATPEQNAALVADLRTEISRLKDAELQEEFLKLELETARYERELQQITVPSRESKASGGGVAGRSSLDSRTYIVSKQKDFVVERSPNGAAGLPRMTGGKLRGNGPAPTVTGTTYAAAADNQLYTEWQQKMEQREERRVQRTASTEQRDDPASTPLARSSIPPPPPPTDADEEIFSKKVKDRVRDLMAAQAAAAEEARGTLRGRAIASAPSTPTAGRKHIEAEFREFREIRQREVVAEKATLATESAKENERQLVQAVHNHAPSRIPLATSSSKKVPTVQRATPAPPPKAATVTSDESGLASAEEIKVNVAALIATHQEKQQLQQVAQPVAPAQPPKGSTPSRQHQDVVSGPNGAGSAPAEAQEQMQQDEPSVSVSDKCQQFEQRIRRNSESGKGDATIATVGRKPTGTTGHQQARAGVWSPFNRSTEILTKEELAERSSSSSRGKPTELQQPVWTPRSAPPSPATERREFRPIGFESPTPTRRVLTPSPAATSASVAAPWTQPGYNPPLAVSSEPKTNPRTTPLQTSASNPTIGGTPQRTTPSAATPPPPGQQYQVRFAPQQRSNSNEPTINSLLKSKDGKTASVGVADSTERLQKSSTTTSSTSGNRSMSSSSTTTTTTTYQQQQQQQQQQSGNSSVNRLVSPGPRIGPSIDQPDSTAQVTQNSNMQQTAHHKVDGIGPITREGMPLTLRSEIDEGNRDKWYKQMYHTLHKAHDDDDYVTVRYKTRRGYPYKSSGYQSEPEPNYDSDYTIKYSTLDRRRIPLDLSPASYSKFNTLQSNPSPPQHFHQPSAKAGLASYRNQPGRIENYTPGRSSISEKESKEWWDEVMDIFNGQLEHQKLTTSKTYTEGNLSRALKEQGYESDSTLVFRKREPPASAALSPVEQKQHYKTMQAGGEIPLHGFRKPAPEKPKESPRRYIESDVNIHYKTPIRFEYKEPIPDDELAYRQAEHMRRVYQEERRRKYINELEDMHSRRHTDNIPPSQKSPIPLNRYDDFAADLSPVPQHVVKQPKTIARALYNFQGQSIRELSFRKGDIIHLRRQVDKNWYEGEHNANVGLLPANYIEILSRDTANAKPLPKKPAREGKARAKFNFTAQTGVELSLLKGELVTLTRRVDDNWFEGKIGSKKGIFPVSYVEILTDINGEESYDIEPIVNRPQSAHGVTSQPSQTLTTHYGTKHTNGRVSPGILRETKTVQKTEVLHVDTSNEPISYRALYNYKPQNSDELELLEGDVVYVLEKCDDGWYVGTSARTGCFGTFPGNYVSKM